jgi:hypothetical protein
MFGNQARFSLPLLSTSGKTARSSEKINIISETEADVDRAKSELIHPNTDLMAASNLVSTDAIPISIKARPQVKNIQKAAKRTVGIQSPTRKRTVVSHDIIAPHLSTKKRRLVTTPASDRKQYSKYKKIF